MNSAGSSLRVVSGLLWASFSPWPAVSPAAAEGWQAGTARVAITPRDPMWMAGYGSRNKPSEGAVHDLWAKALALQDPAGRKAVLVTLDVCGIGRDLSTAIRDGIQDRHGLAREQVVLACSHTHCGPVVGTNLLTMYKLDDAQRGKIKDYARFLAQTVGEVVDSGDGRPRTGPARLGDRPVRLRGQPPEQQGEGRPRAAREARPGRPRRPRRPGAPRPRARRQGPRRGLRLRLPLHGARLLQVLRRLRGLRPARDREAQPRVAGDVRRGLRGRSEPAPAADARAGRGLRTAARRRGRSRPGRADAADRGSAPARLPGDRPGVRPPARPRAGRERRGLERLLHRQPRQAPAGADPGTRQARPRTTPIPSRSGGSTT